MFCVANGYDVGTDAVSLVVRWDDTVILNLVGVVRHAKIRCGRDIYCSMWLEYLCIE